MNNKPLIFCSALLAALSLLCSCGGIPDGITEEEKPSHVPTDEPTEAPSVSPLPEMDLTPVQASGIGAGETEKVEKLQVTLHYITDEGYVLPVQADIPKQDGIARACLLRLRSNGEHENELKAQGLNAPIPAETEIGLEIDNGEASVELYGMSAFESGERELALFTAIVNTLTQFESIDTVTIYIDGDNGRTPNGTDMPSKSTNYALNVEDGAIETAASGELSQVTLYFPNYSGSTFVPITRYSNASRGLYSALAMLAEGTGKSGLRACFPDNTLILGAAIENGILTVNCSDDFVKVQQTPGLYSLAMRSVLLTAMPFGSIDEVCFQVNGTAFEPAE